MSLRLLALAGGLSLLVLGNVPSAAGQAGGWSFRTPGDAVYCRGYLECVTPNDGFWIRFSGGYTDEARITKGYAERWRGFRDRSVRVLGFDSRAWMSSDAAVFTCVSRRTGLTCNHWQGLAFWLGRFRGYRTYRGPPGSVPDMDPFFRTANGLWCGNASPLEPTYMILGCWRVRDGTTVTLPHGQRMSRLDVRRNPHGRDYRPRGFPLLRPGETFVVRCRRVTPRYADRCSTRGLATVVLTCRAASAVLRCTNRFGRGFVFGPRVVDPI
jgi:hypothetical protein